MEGRPTWTDCDEAGDYVVPNVLSPRDLVSRPDNMDETVPHMTFIVDDFGKCVIRRKWKNSTRLGSSYPPLTGCLQFHYVNVSVLIKFLQNNTEFLP